MIIDDIVESDVKSVKVLSVPGRGVGIMDAFDLKNKAFLLAVRGSIIRYNGDVAVNSATKGGDEGQAPEGSVDKAFQDQGGYGVVRARREVELTKGRASRIPEGTAVMTHPGQCNASAIVHATGPNYEVRRKDTYHLSDESLVETYKAALTSAYSTGAKSVGFCLISAGRSRGERDLKAIVQMAVDVIAANALPGTEVTIVAHTEDEVIALKEACRTLKANIISHVMDESAKIEEEKLERARKQGTRRAVEERVQVEPEKRTYNHDLCGPGFIGRHFKALLQDRKAPAQQLKVIMNKDRPTAIGFVIVGTLRFQSNGIRLHSCGGAEIRELIQKVWMLRQLRVLPQEVYDLPETEERFKITHTFEEAGNSYERSRIKSIQGHSREVRQAIETQAEYEVLNVKSDKFEEWLVHGSLAKHAWNIKTYGLYAFEKQIFWPTPLKRRAASAPAARL